MRKILFLLLIAAGPIAAQSINPATQIVWPRVTGSGAPTLTCGSIEYGMPYTDLSQNPAVSYHCTTHGWQTDSGGGTVGPGTNKFFACFSGTTNVGNCHADDGATTASTVTVTEPVVIAPGGSSAGWMKAPAGTAPSGAAGAVVYSSDSTNGYAEVNENNTGLSRVCTAANGICQPPTTFQTGGVNNSSQTTLNLVAGTNVTLTNSSGGNVTIAASGGGGSYPTPVTLTASNSSELDFTTCIDTHRDYELRFSDLVGSATSTNIYVQFSTNGGSTYDTTSGHYVWGESYVGVNASTGLTGSSQNNDIGFLVGGFGATTPSTVDGTMRIYNLPNSTSYKSGNSVIAAQNGPTFSSSNVQTIGDLYTQTAAVNALRIIPASGTLVSGTVTCQPIPQ